MKKFPILDVFLSDSVKEKIIEYIVWAYLLLSTLQKLNFPNNTWLVGDYVLK